MPLDHDRSGPAIFIVTDSQLQMLSQRILARRLPQVAARHAIATRASFSQVAALRAAEIEDPLQVRRQYGRGAIALMGQ